MNGDRANPAPEQERSSPVKRVLGYLFALGCLVWVFHDIHPQRLLSAITIAHWWFLPLAVFFDVLTYVLQGLRWALLLSPVGRLRSLRATQAIYVGLFTNEVVPLRFGELVRAFLASRWIGSGISAVVPSMVVERFLDALWLAIGIGLAAIYVPLPKNLIEAGDILGAVVLAATIVFAWIVFRRERELEHEPVERDGHGIAESELAHADVQMHEPQPAQTKSRLLAPVREFISRLAAGLRDIGVSRDLYLAAALSAGMLLCQALTVWFIMLAYGLDLTVGAAAVVLLIVRLGTAIPNAPANVGSFQFFTVLALGLFGVDKTVAAGFSIVDFVVLTAPLWILGLIALSRTGMTLSSIRAEIGALKGNRMNG